jgi:hypothetical protein
MEYTIVHTTESSDPHKFALTLSACLGADKGVGSEVTRDPKTRGAWLVIADDGKAIRVRKLV